MKIQSLSVVVPNNKCVNNCKFCVSRMHCGMYKNQMDENLPFFDLYLNDYLKRLEFSRDNGCNTVMLTGSSEPQQNRKFLTYFGMFQRMMKRPFEWIEMQTTGVMLDNGYLRFLRNHVGVNLISISVSSFSKEQNNNIIGSPKGLEVDLDNLCKEIKKYDFTLRLSINLTDQFDNFNNRVESILNYCKYFGADQVTFRVLYSDGSETEQSKWVKEHAANPNLISEINYFITTKGHLLGRLPYGAYKYGYNGMCIVVDDDCMAKNESKKKDTDESENYKYLILRENCKLYSSWDDEASLIF